MTQEAPTSLSCEVIILTALRVEYQAVLYHLQQPQEVIHPSGTIYHWGSFAGKYHIWRVAVAEIGMGGVSAATETERAISFFHPQFLFFVGIAGGLKDVALGDVVAATKVYAYEAGKAAQRFEPRPELWRASHVLEQRARAEARNDEWLARLENSSSGRAPQVFIGALAAGEKVLASTQSSIYRTLKATYGDALAIEMEGHGFLHAVHVNHIVHGLVIRGISDLIGDKQEAEAEGSQQTAAKHASGFAFELLAKLDGGAARQAHGLSIRFGSPFPEVWTVSRRHNPFFTGRDQLLQRLFDNFAFEIPVGMVRAQAITGLGGMGKTQTAAEYAYRFRGHYRAVLWIKAETHEDLVADFQAIAGLLKQSQANLQERARLIQTLQEWFMAQAEWLLILDNADDLAMVDPFLPKAARGHILLTTRARATSAQAQPLVLEPLSPEDGAICILRRAGMLTWNGQLRDASQADAGAAQALSRMMDGLPLALEQAGAYIEDTACGVRRYLHLYQQYRAEIQRLHHGAVPNYPESVASAWRVSRNIVEQSNPAASELLRLCTFLAPEAIPDELLTKGAPALGPVLGSVAADPVALDLAIGVLRKYSLLNREADRETDLTRLSIHRILQEILQDEMDEPTQQLWAQRAVCVVSQALPVMTWQIMQAHARRCVQLIEQWNMTFPEADFVQRYVEATGYTEKR